MACNATTLPAYVATQSTWTKVPAVIHAPV